MDVDIYDELCDKVYGFVKNDRKIMFLTKEQIKHLDNGLEVSGNLMDNEMCRDITLRLGDRDLVDDNLFSLDLTLDRNWRTKISEGMYSAEYGKHLLVYVLTENNPDAERKLVKIRHEAMMILSEA